MHPGQSAAAMFGMPAMTIAIALFVATYVVIMSDRINRAVVALLGDPPNIMIGSAAGLTFNDFAWHLTPVILVTLAVTFLPLYFIWGRHMATSEEHRARVMAFNEREAITDPRLLKQSLTVIAIV